MLKGWGVRAAALVASLLVSLPLLVLPTTGAAGAAGATYWIRFVGDGHGSVTSQGKVTAKETVHWKLIYTLQVTTAPHTQPVITYPVLKPGSTVSGTVSDTSRHCTGLVKIVPASATLGATLKPGSKTVIALTPTTPGADGGVVVANQCPFGTILVGQGGTSGCPLAQSKPFSSPEYDWKFSARPVTHSFSAACNSSAIGQAYSWTAKLDIATSPLT